MTWTSHLTPTTCQIDVPSALGPGGKSGQQRPTRRAALSTTHGRRRPVMHMRSPSCRNRERAASRPVLRAAAVRARRLAGQQPGSPPTAVAGRHADRARRSHVTTTRAALDRSSASAHTCHQPRRCAPRAASTELTNALQADETRLRPASLSGGVSTPKPMLAAGPGIRGRPIRGFRTLPRADVPARTSAHERARAHRGATIADRGRGSRRPPSWMPSAARANCCLRPVRLVSGLLLDRKPGRSPEPPVRAYQDAKVRRRACLPRSPVPPTSPATRGFRRMRAGPSNTRRV